MPQERSGPLDEALAYHVHGLKTSETKRVLAHSAYEVAEEIIKLDGSIVVPDRAPRVVNTPSYISTTEAYNNGIFYVDTSPVKMSVADTEYNVFLRTNLTRQPDRHSYSRSLARPGVDMLARATTEKVARILCTFEEERTLDPDGEVLDELGTQAAFNMLGNFRDTLMEQKGAREGVPSSGGEV